MVVTQREFQKERSQVKQFLVNKARRLCNTVLVQKEGLGRGGKRQIGMFSKEDDEPGIKV